MGAHRSALPALRVNSLWASTAALVFGSIRSEPSARRGTTPLVPWVAPFSIHDGLAARVAVRTRLSAREFRYQRLGDSEEAK